MVIDGQVVVEEIEEEREEREEERERSGLEEVLESNRRVLRGCISRSLCSCSVED